MTGLAAPRNGTKAGGEKWMLSRNASNGINRDLEFLKEPTIGWVDSQFIRRLSGHRIRLDTGLDAPLINNSMLATE
jgi:hypothetical protein